ncbi:hypothetical protein BGZ49_008412 [Haplosporangium sp. Z 27]|nr:hypothetical protein BGZ49_008412 [Haplosporangium sp. Z 27]
MSQGSYKEKGKPALQGTFDFLQSILPDKYNLSRLTAPNAKKIKIDKPDDKLLETHEELTMDSEDHISAIETGGTSGLERLMGAVLKTGSDKFKIICAEVFSVLYSTP